MRWFTSDLHLGHENIIRYCARPFSSVEEMDDALVTNWNERVAPDDEVWVLGDVARGPIEASLGHVARLSGHKVLVAGNHDRCWAGHPRRHDEWIDRYAAAGFDQIHQGTIETRLAGRTVLAGHFPYEGDSHDEDRFTRWRPVDDGAWLLHGHVHTSWKANGRQINVGVDVWGYAPVSETDLAAIIDVA
jgi:calcineurin-like phosphoesterase family protein